MMGIALIAVGCGSDGGGGAADAGDGDGSGTGDDAERLVVSPTSIAFEDVAIGETDIQTLLLSNDGGADLALGDIAIVQSVEPVRFTSIFLRGVADAAHWADLDGNGHDFEVRDAPLVLAPGASLEIVLQFRPTGEPLDCPDRAPSPCGFLLLAGAERTVSVPIFVPR